MSKEEKERAKKAKEAMNDPQVQKVRRPRIFCCLPRFLTGMCMFQYTRTARSWTIPNFAHCWWIPKWRSVCALLTEWLLRLGCALPWPCLISEWLQEVMRKCSQSNVAFQQYMRDPKIGPKLRKMIEAGLLRVEWFWVNVLDLFDYCVISPSFGVINAKCCQWHVLILIGLMYKHLKKKQLCKIVRGRSI